MIDLMYAPNSSSESNGPTHMYAHTEALAASHKCRYSEGICDSEMGTSFAQRPSIVFLSGLLAGCEATGTPSATSPDMMLGK